MTKAFKRKIINQRNVATRKYWYRLRDCVDHAVIERCPVEYIGRTASLDLDNWETVKRLPL